VSIHRNPIGWIHTYGRADINSTNEKTASSKAHVFDVAGTFDNAKAGCSRDH